MSLPFEIENRLEEIRREVEKLGMELVDVAVRRGGRNMLTIIADKAGGITLDDCSRINGHLGRYFDESPGTGDFFNSSYYLEVNSPGLDRPLKLERDFLRVKGQSVRVAFRAESGAGIVRIGKVLEVQDGILKLQLPGEAAPLAITMGAITKAGLEIK